MEIDGIIDNECVVQSSAGNEGSGELRGLPQSTATLTA
jgi:hypothetical protein